MKNVSVLKKVTPFYVDKRGEMSHILDGKEKFTSALLITCKKGAIRANHYHKKDTHFSYMLKGKMEYTFKELDKKNARKKTIIVNKGEVVCTPPMVVHAMRFLENSEFLALTTEERDPEKYEKDTVRTELIK